MARRGRSVAGLMAVLSMLGWLGVPLTAAPALSGEDPAPVGETTAAAVTGGRFVAMPPTRILDTRTGAGAPKRALAAGGSLTLRVAGRGGVPPSGAGAAAMRVAVLAPRRAGSVVMFTSGTARPAVPTVSFNAARGAADLALVGIGAQGAVIVANRSTGALHLSVDVLGWFSAGTTGPNGFTAVRTARVLDTRAGVGAPRRTLAAGRALTVTVARRAGVPASGAAAVAARVAVASPAAAGSLLVHAADGTRPKVSALRFDRGRSAAAAVLTGIGAGGKITVVNASKGTVHASVDVSGWFRSGVPIRGGFAAVTTARILDTAAGVGAPRAVLRAGRSLTVSVSGRGGIPAAEVAAAALRVGVVAPTAAGSLMVRPAGDAATRVETVKFARGAAGSATTLTDLGDNGRIVLTNTSAGTVHLTADALGWFADPVPPPPAVGPKSEALRGFSRGRWVASDEEVRQNLASERSRVCRVTSDQIPADLGTALAAAAAFVTAREGAQALAAFRATAAYGDGDLAIHAAAQALVANRPGAALVALLRAHALQPSAAGPLANAAGVLVGLGRPGLALALLDAAEAAGTLPDMPMQMRTDAMMLTNRGSALFQLGRYGDADALFAEALERDPDLAEAAFGRAYAALCRGNLDAAVEHYRAASRRGLPAGTPLVGDRAQPYGTGDQPSVEVFDTSAGRQFEGLPKIQMPSTPTSMAAAYPTLAALDDAAQARMWRRDDEADALLAGLRSRTAATEKRDRDIVSAIDSFSLFSDCRQPGVKALCEAANKSDVRVWWFAQSPDGEDGQWELEITARKIFDGCEESDDWQACYDDTFQPICRTYLNVHHNEFLDVLAQDRAEWEAWLRATHPIRSGLAANVEDPDLHKALSLRADNEAEAGHGLYLRWARNWAAVLNAHQPELQLGSDTDIGLAQYCAGAGGAAEPIPDVAADPDDSLPCPPEFDKYSPGFALGVVSVNFDCSSVEIEVSNPGWIGWFAEARYDFRADTITVFMGARQGLASPYTDTGVSLKEGLFVTVGRDTLVDAGLRVKSEATLG